MWRGYEDKRMILFLIVLYFIVAAIIFILGFGMVCSNAEYGKDDEEYKYGKIMVRSFIVWPVALFLIYRDKVKQAEDDDGEEFDVNTHYIWRTDE